MMQPGTHRAFTTERVLFGRAAEESLADELGRLRRGRVFIVTNRSLAGSEALRRIIRTLGAAHAGTYAGVTAHVPRSCVVEGAAAARAAEADLLLALGGGSVIDATKVMVICLRYGINEASGLDGREGLADKDPSLRPPDAPSWTRFIALPTTFSAAEFTWFGGVTDPERGMKQPFGEAMAAPQAIILDPALTLTAPVPMLLATGVKALDHAAERLANLNSHAFNDALCMRSLTLLARSLPGIRETPDDLEIRHEAQLATWMSIAGMASGVRVGASHAIGHVLGAHSGVSHGHTSCVMLPAVMEWNRAANAERQAMISEALGRPGVEASVALGDLIASLGMPRRLRDVGVLHSDLDAVARKVMHDFGIRANPRPVQNPADAREILELAW
jgi:maleylacetate reductase